MATGGASMPEVATLFICAVADQVALLYLQSAHPPTSCLFSCSNVKPGHVYRGHAYMQHSPSIVNMCCRSDSKPTEFSWSLSTDQVIRAALGQLYCHASEGWIGPWFMLAKLSCWIHEDEVTCWILFKNFIQTPFQKFLISSALRNTNNFVKYSHFPHAVELQYMQSL